MEEIKSILRELSSINTGDDKAKEKVALLWRKAFLKEKEMKYSEKIGLYLLPFNDLMAKNIYAWNFFNKEDNASEIESFLNGIIDEVYKELYKKGFITEKCFDSCFNICKDAALLLYVKLKSYNLKPVIIHTNDLGLEAVPHFFVIVEIGNKRYVIDMTFRQFLVVPYFIPEIVYHFQNNFLSPASFGHQDFFKELGVKGFFEATEENLRYYIGGFNKAASSVLPQYNLMLKRVKKETDIDSLLERLNSECEKFDIERYAAHLA